MAVPEITSSPVPEPHRTIRSGLRHGPVTRSRGSVLVVTAVLIVVLGIAVTGLIRLALLNTATGVLEAQREQARALAEAGLQWGFRTHTGTTTPLALGAGHFEVIRDGDTLLATGRVGDAAARLSCVASVTSVPESRLNGEDRITWRAVNLLGHTCRIDGVKISWDGSTGPSAAYAASPPGARPLRLFPEHHGHSGEIRSGDLLLLTRDEGQGEGDSDSDDKHDGKGQGGEDEDDKHDTGSDRHGGHGDGEKGQDHHKKSPDPRTKDGESPGHGEDRQEAFIELAPLQAIEITMGPFTDAGRGGGLPGLLRVTFHTPQAYLHTTLLPR